MTAGHHLYAQPRENFIALRAELVKEARAAGDEHAAGVIAKMAKPTISAYIVNMMARGRDEIIHALADLGEEMREAHAQLDGRALMSLSHNRNDLIREAMRQAAEVADEDGITLSETVSSELHTIFTAAVANEEVASLMVLGQMTSAKNLPETGWALSLAQAPQPAKPKKKAKQAPPPDPKLARKIDAAKDALADARAEVKAAEVARADAQRAIVTLDEEKTLAMQEVQRLQGELAAAEKRARQARRQSKEYRDEVLAAQQRSDQAWRAVQAAEAALAELTGG